MAESGLPVRVRGALATIDALTRQLTALEAELAERSQAFERAAADSVRLEEELVEAERKSASLFRMLTLKSEEAYDYREALEEIALHEVRETEPTPCDWHCAAMMVGVARKALDTGDGAQAVAPKDSGEPAGASEEEGDHALAENRREAREIEDWQERKHAAREEEG